MDTKIPVHPAIKGKTTMDAQKWEIEEVHFLGNSYILTGITRFKVQNLLE